MKKSELTKIARLYYEKKLTQQQIADMTGISRMAVSRALSKCEDEGIVEIKINYDDSYTDMEERIRAEYKLKEVYIVPYDENNDIQNDFLSEKAVSVLSENITAGSNVGIGWGATMRAVKEYVLSNEMPQRNALFVPLLGGYGNTDAEFHANQVAAALARSFGGTSLQLHAPAIVSSPELKKVLITDSSIQIVFEKFDSLDVVLNSFGSLSNPGASLFSSGYFSPEDIKEIKDTKIECDIVSCIYLDINGKKHGLNLLERTIGISEEAFTKIPLKIAVAGGKNKLKATRLVAKGNYIDILITDELTGEYLLNG
ncbi:MAG: sugar-binding transcriptional regulator [Eubacteriaceae bacterium]|nr:sugar-binding transcriptional regulator [Eubacteriaceae bacterium]